MDLASIRSDYSKAELDSKTVDANPIDQFKKWMNEAIESKLPEPTAMYLATVNEYNRPTGRIVLLKGVQNAKLVFFTNYQSDKGKALDTNPACSVTFFWQQLERQVRVEGIASRISTNRSDEYFKSRPRDSQVGAWASPQSAPISNRVILSERVSAIETRYKGQEQLPRPHQWGGYEIDPFVFEFWQGRPSRLHDRILYVKEDNSWRISRLAP